MATTSSGVTTETYEHLPQMRLLYCITCKTIDELPDFLGRPEDDTTLNYLVDKHGPSHEGQMYRLPIGFWIQEPIKAEIIKQIKGGGSGGLEEFDATFYDTRNIFQDDAMTCFKKHLRPQEGCPDWRSESKELKPNTRAERKEAGLSLEPVGPKVYLCDFCPARAYYERKSRGE